MLLSRLPRGAFAFVFLLVPVSCGIPRRIPPNPDQMELNYAGWRMLHGERPYVDVVSCNWPGSLWMHMGAIAAFGNRLTAWRIADAPLMLATVAGAGWFLRSAFDSLTAAIGDLLPGPVLRRRCGSPFIAISRRHIHPAAAAITGRHGKAEAALGRRVGACDWPMQAGSAPFFLAARSLGCGVGHGSLAGCPRAHADEPCDLDDDDRGSRRGPGCVLSRRRRHAAGEVLGSWNSISLGRVLSSEAAPRPASGIS